MPGRQRASSGEAKLMPRTQKPHPGPDLSWRTATLVVAMLGTTVLTARCWMLRDRPFIGSPDEAAYTHQASMILAGHGLRVNYVQHFFTRYSRLPHPEDHYGPGLGVILAPVLAARIGPTDFAAVLPALVVGSLLVPLMTLLAARRLGASPALAVGGATFSLLALLPQDLSGRVLADVPFTAILFAAWLTVWRHRPAPAWRWFWAGALLGVAYLLKPAALLHVPALLPTLWLGAAEREGELGRGDRVRAFAALCVGLALPTLPWMARNAAVYGDPLHSANKHIAVGEDYREDWQENGFRRVWWAHPGDEIPTLSKALGQYGAGRMAEVLLRRLRLSLAGREVWWLTLALLVGAGMLRRREGWSLAAYHLGHAALLAAVFPVWPRYLLLLWPAAGALVSAALSRLCHDLAVDTRPRSAQAARNLSLAAAVCVGVLAAWPGPQHLWTHLVVYGPSGSAALVDPAHNALKDVARWCGAALPPDSVLMVQDCWRFVHYSGLPSVNIPTDSASAIDAVVRAYGVTHVVLIPEATTDEDLLLARDYLKESRLDWERQPSATAEVYACSSPGLSTAM